MTEPTRRVAVTGATGYIGRELVRAALAAGLEVTAMVRRRPPWLEALPVRCVPFDLSEPIGPEAVEGVDTLFHLAADTRDEALIDDLAEDDEVLAAARLCDLAARIGARFVFASSPSALADAPSRYGRVKWRIEHVVAERAGVIVRPGLVYGGAAGPGLFGRLSGIVGRVPVLPALVPAPRVQPIYIRDLCGALLGVARAPSVAKTYDIADPEPVSFTRLLKAIAVGRLRRRRLFVPVPSVLVVAAATVARRVPGLPNVGADRVLSLMAVRPVDSAGSLRALDIELTTLEDGMHPSGSVRRRRLIEEGRGLISYVVGASASPRLIRRYVRALEALDQGSALGLPGAVLRSRARLAAREASAARDGPAWGLRDRLDAALAIAEASPDHADRFMALKRRSWLGTFARLALLGLRDVPFQVARFVARRRVRGTPPG